MSYSRQNHQQDHYSEALFADGHLPVRGLRLSLPDRHSLPSHTHSWGQIVYARQGTIEVGATAQTWMIPPTRAVYVPPGAEHELLMRGCVEMRTLYLAPPLADELPRRACALDVTALLRELLLHIVDLGALESDTVADQHIARVLIDQVVEGCAGSVELPMPRDIRARRVAERVLSNPGETVDAAELASSAGASLRTLQRLFRAETARSFDEWRTRARLLRSTVLLNSGHSVTQAALLVGYQSLSAFISAYRKAFGVTPGHGRAGRGLGSV